EYDERLTVPVWWWLPGAVAAAVLAIEVHLAARSVPLPAVVLPVAALLVGLLLALGRTRVTVRSGELRVAGARLPLRLGSGRAGPARGRRRRGGVRGAAGLGSRRGLPAAGRPGRGHPVLVGEHPAVGRAGRRIAGRPPQVCLNPRGARCVRSGRAAGSGRCGR